MQEKAKIVKLKIVYKKPADKANIFIKELIRKQLKKAK